MEAVAVLLAVIVVLAPFVLAPIVFMLHRRLRDLERRQAELEGRRRTPERSQPAPLPAPLPALPPIPRPAPAPMPARAPTPAPRPGAPGAAVPAPGSPSSVASLESFLGGRVLLVAGVIAVLFALAFFLKVAIDRGWIGPGLRIGLGVVAGLALLAGGDRMRARGFTTYGHSLMGAGLGALYLCDHFACVRYGFIGRPTAFVLAGVLTATGAAWAVLRSAPLLAWLGFLGGFLAPALLGEGNDVLGPLTAWLSILQVGVVLVLARRPWSGLEALGSVASVLYFAFWMDRWFHAGQEPIAATCLTVLFAGVLAVSLSPALLGRRRVPLLGLFLAAGAGFLSLLVSLELFHPAFETRLGLAWLAAGVVHAGLAALFSKRHGSGGREAQVLLGLALAWIAASVPLLIDDPLRIPPAWAALGAVAVWADRRVGGDVLAVGGLLTVIAAQFHVFSSLPLHEDAFTPFLNLPFLLSILPSVSFVALAAMLSTAPAGPPRTPRPGFGPGVVPVLIYVGVWSAALLLGLEPYRHFDLLGSQAGLPAHGLAGSAVTLALFASGLAVVTRRRAPLWSGLAFGPLAAAVLVGLAMLTDVRLGSGGFSVLFNAIFGAGLAVTLAAFVLGSTTRGPLRPVAFFSGVIFLLVLLTAEIHTWGETTPLAEGLTRRAAEFRAQVIISATWALYASALVGLGFRRQRTGLRWAGLGVFLLTLAKVFLFDLSELDTAYRIGSFLALGVLLVGASFLYQRSRLTSPDGSAPRDGNPDESASDESAPSGTGSNAAAPAPPDAGPDPRSAP